MKVNLYTNNWIKYDLHNSLIELFQRFFCLLLFFGSCHAIEPKVKVGVDNLFVTENIALLKGKRVGLITNHTAICGKMNSTIDLLRKNQDVYGYKITAFFAPEHGLEGALHAGEHVEDITLGGIPVYSLHGKTRRPTEKMLKNIDVLIYDIQDIGSRSYTYLTTLLYAMEESAKHHLTVMVLDRPNPINGLMVDGPVLKDEWRSFVGYLNVPYCHGMTVGELALYYNKEYGISCKLHVVPMQGWKREMSFADTGLPWIPTSPNIPEASTALYYPTTGLIGELGIVNIGIGFTMPFKLIGAPWINADKFSQCLNKQGFPGVYFKPYHYRPSYGKFAHEDLQGVLILITNTLTYRPVATQYLLLGILKSLYPKQFKEALDKAVNNKAMFNKVNGTDEVYKLLHHNKPIAWQLRLLHADEREAFLLKRRKYLIYPKKG